MVGLIGYCDLSVQCELDFGNRKDRLDRITIDPFFSIFLLYLGVFQQPPNTFKEYFL